MKRLYTVLRGKAMPTKPQDSRFGSVSNATTKDKEPDAILTVV